MLFPAHVARNESKMAWAFHLALLFNAQRRWQVGLVYDESAVYRTIRLIKLCMSTLELHPAILLQERIFNAWPQASLRPAPPPVLPVVFERMERTEAWEAVYLFIATETRPFC